jgi:hypothetical protein
MYTLELFAAGSHKTLVIRQHIVNEILQELVSTETLAGLGILHHEIFEFVYVARRLQDRVGRQCRALNLEQVLFQDVLLDGAARWAIIIQAYRNQIPK